MAKPEMARLAVRRAARKQEVWVAVLLVVSALIFLTGCVAVQSAPAAAAPAAETPAAGTPTGRPTAAGSSVEEVAAIPAQMGAVEITVTDEGVTAPANIPAGLAHVVFANTGEKGHVLEVIWMADGVTPEEAMSEPPLGVPDKSNSQSAVFLHPGAQLEAMMDFSAHPQYVVVEDFVENPTHAVMVASGTDGLVEPPKADVEVELVNFAYVMPDPIAPGAQWWHLVNKGSQRHEVSLHPIEEGRTAQDILHDLAMIDANGQVPPPPTEIPELMVGVGQEAWVLWDLPAGKYLAACQVPDFSTMPPGMDHFNLGMFREFTVGP